MHDETAREIIDLYTNQLVAWYLMASYMYYIEDTPILSDVMYDSICQRLLDSWTTIEHQHKYLIDREALRAGTGFHLSAAEYPIRTICAARKLAGVQ